MKQRIAVTFQKWVLSLQELA